MNLVVDNTVTLTTTTGTRLTALVTGKTQLNVAYISGPAGVVSATYPVIYDAGSKNISFDSAYLTGLSAGVASLNSLTGNLNLRGIGGNIFISPSGTTIFISGSGIANSGDLALLNQRLGETGSLLHNWITGISGNAGGITIQQLESASGALTGRIYQTGIDLYNQLYNTGQNLFNRDASISGGLDARIALSGSVAVTHANGVGENLSGNLAQTGATLLAADLSLSGALTGRIYQTGLDLYNQLYNTGQLLFNRDAAISGGLEVRISASGNSAVAHANGVGINLSGDLTQTGQILDNRFNLLSGIDVSMSGWVGNVVSGGLSIRLALTGAALAQRDLDISGALQSQISAGNGTQVRITGSSTLSIADFTGIGGAIVFSSGGQVFISGGAGGAGGGVSSLNGLTNAINILGTGGLTVLTVGQNILVSGDWSVSGNLTQTGVQLGSKIDLVSGWVITVVSGGLETRLFATGNSAVAHANGVGVNISGNLTSTGQTLNNRIDLLSGQTVSLSGWGNNVVSGGLSVRLADTGAALIQRDLDISGGIETRIFNTGNAAVIHANGIGTNLSGNLTTTGQTLNNRIDLLSGQTVSLSGWTNNVVSGGINVRFGLTGAALAQRDLDISGGLEVRIIATGNSAVAHANSVGQTISGNLTITGQTLNNRIDLLSGQTVSLSGWTNNVVSGGLETRITQTGNSAVVHANGIGINLSGNLTATGQTLNTRIDLLSGIDVSMSGWVGNVVSGGLDFRLTQTGSILWQRDLSISGALQTQISAGNGTQVRVSGSTTLSIADFTGLGGTLVLWSGGTVFISGGGGGPGGGVTSLNGLTNAVNILGTGGISAIVVGQNIILSGDQSISGYVLNVSGGLETRIFNTGNAAVIHANGIGVTLSGNLTTTGQTLDNRINLVSGQVVSLSGWTNNVVSGGIDVRLALTGSALAQRDINISGDLEVRITATGNSAVAHSNGVGVNLSGNLTVTGQTLNNRIDLISGQVVSLSGWTNNVVSGGLETRIFATGNSAVVHANGIGVNLSGNLTTTGQTLNTRIDLLSGIDVSMSGWANNVVSGGLSTRLALTGAALAQRDLDISGGLEVRIRISGSDAVVHANGIGTIISGNLTTTGSTLNTRIDLLSGIDVSMSGWTNNVVSGGISARFALTGAALETRIINTGNSAVTHANGIGANLSGNLTTTGSTLNTRIDLVSGQVVSLSGFTIGVSGALQAQITAGNGTEVRVSGSNTLTIADFTGIGGTLILWSGGQVFISGGGGGPGGGVPSVNEITSAVTITGTGNFTTRTIGSTIYISGGANTTNLQVLFDNQNTTSGSNDFTWNNLTDTLDIGTGNFGRTGGASLSNNSLRLNLLTISGVGVAQKPLLSVAAETGWANTYLQSAFWSSKAKIFSQNNAATQSIWGDTAANVGTLLNSVTEALGDYTQVTPAAGLSAGISATNASIYRGSTLGLNGFFFSAKFLLNSVWASGLATSVYGRPSGCRFFCGLTDQAVATQVGLNEPIGNMVGLNYLWASGGSVGTGQYMQNWAIRTRDNVATSTGTTAMTFQTGFYRFSMFCPPWPNNNRVYWELKDLIRDSGVEGAVTTNLPIGSTAMRPMVALGFVSGIKTMGLSSLYVEKRGSYID